MSRNATLDHSTGRRGSHVVPVAMLFTGAVVAIVPASVQAAASSLFSTQDQALIAVALSLGAFAAGVLNGGLLESRLAVPAIRQRTFIPLPASLVAAAAAIVLAIVPRDAVIVAVCLPLIMCCLQLGRTHAIIESLWRSELVSGLVLLVACLAAFLLGRSESELAITTLAIGVLVAIVVRQLSAPRWTSEWPPTSHVAWVGAETAIVASTPFVLNVCILVFIGAEEAIGFRLILTTLGVMQPVLGYLRTVLLGRASRRLTIAMSALSCVALMAVVVADLLGALQFVFGASWLFVSTAALTIACAWKLLSIPANLPFARLRRSGRVAEVFTARTISTVTYLALGVLAAIIFRMDWAVFVAFAAAEVVTFCVYEFVDRRRRTLSGRSAVALVPAGSRS